MSFARAAVVAIVALFAWDAAAYPWMINHGYTSCATCHVDPSGAGALTLYGRAQNDILVRWHIDPSVTEEGEASPTASSMFGLVPLPAWFDLSGNFRGAALGAVDTSGNGVVVPVLMAADASVTFDLHRVVAHATVGYGLRNVGPIVAWSPDQGPNNALVSRTHWVGVTFLDRELFARAGRIQLPYGLRNVEHTSFVRAQTGTGLALDQQHGFALAYNGSVVRGEAMAVFGNFQLRPEELRQKGYSGYVEAEALEGLAIGASSKLTYAPHDLELGDAGMRHAHGLHVRWAPLHWCVVLAEGAATFVHGASSTAIGGGSLLQVELPPWQSVHMTPEAIGGVGWLQVDLQPWQGVHVMPALEARYTGDTTDPAGGAWLSLAWHPLPHTELRVDGIYRQLVSERGLGFGNFTGLLQAHFYL